MIECEPWVKPVQVNVAIPVVLSTLALPMLVPPYLNWTVPAVTAAFP